MNNLTVSVIIGSVFFNKEINSFISFGALEVKRFYLLEHIFLNNLKKVEEYCLGLLENNKDPSQMIIVRPNFNEKDETAQVMFREWHWFPDVPNCGLVHNPKPKECRWLPFEK